jgi:lipoprotein-releasing system ATP-binding protein
MSVIAEVAPAPAPTTPLVEVRGLRKTFVHDEKELEVLKGLSFDLAAGEMVCVVGPSGAGKSTLLHVLGTLDVPTAGGIRYRGEVLTTMSPQRLAQFRNRHIGFVFQFHHLLPEFTALENVMMPGLIQGLSPAEMGTRARTILDEVGLAARLTHRPGELSGGERQRVALARALVLGPGLLLADEPTGNLDTATSNAMHDLFFDLNQRRGTTMVIVTHNRELAERMPRVLRMRDGLIEGS